MREARAAIPRSLPLPELRRGHARMPTEIAAHVRRALEIEAVGDFLGREVGGNEQAFHLRHDLAVYHLFRGEPHGTERDPGEIIRGDAQFVGVELHFVPRMAVLLYQAAEADEDLPCRTDRTGLTVGGGGQGLGLQGHEEILHLVPHQGTDRRSGGKAHEVSVEAAPCLEQLAQPFGGGKDGVVVNPVEEGGGELEGSLVGERWRQVDVPQAEIPSGIGDGKERVRKEDRDVSPAEEAPFEIHCHDGAPAFAVEYHTVCRADEGAGIFLPVDRPDAVVCFCFSHNRFCFSCKCRTIRAFSP